jgi:O-antigen/teichoic acid export membrane protein
VLQRVTAAALGLLALALGFGVVAVCVAFLIGAGVRLVISLHALNRHIGLPRPVFSSSARKELRSRGAPFAAQDVFGLVLAKVDILILSFLASDAVVGLYGAAYRLFEATSFVVYALAGAFSAQYTYLGLDTRPTVRTVFAHSLKLSLILLVPLAVVYATLAEPLCRLFFGSKLVAAAEPLRLLAPAVVLYGLVVLSSSLIVSRRKPRVIIIVIGVVMLLNVGLNFALIPALGANGAATAMLVSELAFAGAAVTIAVRTVGGVPALSTVAAPVVGGAAMAAVTQLLSGRLVAALAAGAVTYLGACVLVDLKVSPGDLRIARDLVRRRMLRISMARPMTAGRDRQ